MTSIDTSIDNLKRKLAELFKGLAASAGVTSLVFAFRNRK